MKKGRGYEARPRTPAEPDPPRKRGAAGRGSHSGRRDGLRDCEPLRARMPGETGPGSVPTDPGPVDLLPSPPEPVPTGSEATGRGTSAHGSRRVRQPSRSFPRMPGPVHRIVTDAGLRPVQGRTPGSQGEGVDTSAPCRIGNGEHGECRLELASGHGAGWRSLGNPCRPRGGRLPAPPGRAERGAWREKRVSGHSVLGSEGTQVPTIAPR